MGLNFYKNGMPRIIAWFNAGTALNSTTCLAELLYLSNKCIIWEKITEELSVKCTSIGSTGHNNDFWTPLVNLKS